MKDFYLLRSKDNGKFYRKAQVGVNVMAVCDMDFDNPLALSHLFVFDSPEAGFQFLQITGKPLPKNTEVVPFNVVFKDPIFCIDVDPMSKEIVPVPKKPDHACAFSGREAGLMDVGKICK